MYTRNHPMPVEVIVEGEPVDPSGGGGGGGASTIADGADVAQGALDDAKATDSSSSWSVIALLKGILDVFLAPASNVPVYTVYRTDVANFRTRTQISVAGADTDELLAAGGAGIRQYVMGGWLQTDIAVVLTFKSNATTIATFTLGAGDMLDLTIDGEPEIYTAANEPLNLTKSTAATITGTLFSKAV